MGHCGSSGTPKSTCYIVKALSRQKAIVKQETVRRGKVILMGGRCPEMANIGEVSYPWVIVVPLGRLKVPVILSRHCLDKKQSSSKKPSKADR
jgi:hypothetical protein